VSKTVTADEYLESLIPLIQAGRIDARSDLSWDEGNGEWLPHGYFPGYSVEYPDGEDDS
jgi:hypothetical protein